MCVPCAVQNSKLLTEKTLNFIYSNEFWMPVGSFETFRSYFGGENIGHDKRVTEIKSVLFHLETMALLSKKKKKL